MTEDTDVPDFVADAVDEALTEDRVREAASVASPNTSAADLREHAHRKVAEALQDHEATEKADMDVISQYIRAKVAAKINSEQDSQTQFK
jgi:hypothetical protein